DVDRARGMLFDRLELFLGEGDELALGELVALDELVTRHRALVLRTPILLFDSGAARFVERIEMDAVGRRDRRIHFDRNRHQAEGDRPRRNGARCHEPEYPGLCGSRWQEKATSWRRTAPRATPRGRRSRS